jgi:hypothetical protein
MKKWLMTVSAMPVMRVRAVALGSAAVGLMLIWMVRG